MGDLLFEFTEWLRTTFLLDLAYDISDTSLSLFIVSHFWIIPTVQFFHIMALAAGFGATLMMSLRIFNLAGGYRPVSEVAARYVPWIWWSAPVLLVTGLLMILGEPVRELINPIFWIKMGLIIVLIAVTLTFQKAVASQAAVAGPEWNAGSGTRLGAFLILVLWCVVMACGRWIAYAPV